MKKKIILTMLLGALGVSVMTGCGSGQNNSKDSKITIVDNLVWEGEGKYADSVIDYFEKNKLSYFYEDGDERADAWTKEADDFLGHKAYYCKDASCEMLIVVTCDSEEEVEDARNDIKQYLEGMEPEDWEQSPVKEYLEEGDWYEGDPTLFYNDKALHWSKDYTDYYILGCELRDTGNYLVKIAGVTEYNDLSDVQKNDMTFVQGNSETYFIIDIGFDYIDGSEISQEDYVDI